MKNFRKCRGRDYSPTQKRLWLYGRQAFSQVFWRGKGAGGAVGEEENSLAASTGVMEALGYRPNNLSGWGSWGFGCSWLQAVPHLWGLPLADQNTPPERYPHPASWGLADTGAQKASPPPPQHGDNSVPRVPEGQAEACLCWVLCPLLHSFLALSKWQASESLSQASLPGNPA